MKNKMFAYIKLKLEQWLFPDENFKPNILDRCAMWVVHAVETICKWRSDAELNRALKRYKQNKHNGDG